MKTKLSRILGVALALVFACSLGAAIVAPPEASADPGSLYWSKTSTPSMLNNLIEPGSNLWDMAVGPTGSKVYVIGDNSTSTADAYPQMWYSGDGGEVWYLRTAYMLPAVVVDWPVGRVWEYFSAVAVAPDNGSFVAVAGTTVNSTGGEQRADVIISTDAGAKFYYSGALVDNTANTTMLWINDMDISPEVLSVRTLVVVGTDNTSAATAGSVYRLNLGGMTANWRDATLTAWAAGWQASTSVIDVEISPNWSNDYAVVCMSVNLTPLTYFVQSAKWATTRGWNASGGFSAPVQIVSDSRPLLAVKLCCPADDNTKFVDGYYGAAGIALPSDYVGSDSGARVIFAYVSGGTAILANGGHVFRIDNDVISDRCGPPGMPFLTSIDHHGTANAGKAMLGLHSTTGTVPDCAADDCCLGVQVYHTDAFDICCPQWYRSCKPPSGQCFAVVRYTPDGTKSYATTMGAGLADESAFSLSLDDAYSWNQIGLIDTDIDWLSDVATIPDNCGKVYLSSINDQENNSPSEVCGCDSVWRSCVPDVMSPAAHCTSSVIGTRWQRVWHGNLGDADMDTAMTTEGLLRIPVDETHPEAVYLGDYGKTNLWSSLDQGQCWKMRGATNLAIQDFAVETQGTIYVLSSGGYVAKTANNGGSWTTAVSTALASGHAISVLPEGNVLVGASTAATKVAYSSDGAATFSRTTVALPAGIANVHPAFDSYFDTNATFYVAASTGVYRWVWGTSSTWKNLYATPTLTQMGGTGTTALNVNYYGIVVDRADGNPMTSAANGGVLYAAYNYGVGVGTTTQVVTGSGSICLEGCTSNATSCNTTGTQTLTSKVGTFIDGEVLNVSGYALTATSSLVSGTISVVGANSAATGIITVSIAVTGFTDAEAVDITSYALTADVVSTTATATTYYTGVARCLTPAATPCCSREVWNYLHAYTTGDECFSVNPSSLRICGCVTADSNSTLWAIDNETYALAAGTDGTLWQYTDCVAKAGVTLVSPAEGADIAADDCECYAVDFTLAWERLCYSCSYDIRIGLDPAALTEVVVSEDNYEPASGANPTILVDGSNLQCATTYYWKVRVSDAESGEYIDSFWSEIRSFTIGAGPGIAITLVSPELATTNYPIGGAALSWSIVPGATSYNFVLSENADLSSPLLSETGLTDSALAYAGTLDYGTSYYWQVTAMKDGNVLATSSIGTFTTVTAVEEVFVCPQCGLEFTSEAALEAHWEALHAPAVIPAPTTPAYIWGIIAIGAVLIIALIVLIVRTRRVA